MSGSRDNDGIHGMNDERMRRRMLILPIKKQWFDMIVKGEKKEEYREIKPYYTTRFKNIGLLDYKDPKQVMIALRNGYSKDSPTLIVTVQLATGIAKKEWGGVPGEVYYILEIVQKHSIYVDNIEVYRYRDGEQQ